MTAIIVIEKMTTKISKQIGFSVPIASMEHKSTIEILDEILKKLQP